MSASWALSHTSAKHEDGSSQQEEDLAPLQSRFFSCYGQKSLKDSYKTVYGTPGARWKQLGICHHGQV